MPRYIGCTKNVAARASAHRSAKNRGNKQRAAWVAELAARGLRPQLRVLARFDSLQEAEADESRRVQEGLAAGWPLTNRPVTKTHFGPHSNVYVDGRGPVTSRQVEILAAIASLTKARGFPPTIREIGAATGIASTNGINDHLVALERFGAVTRRDMIARSLVVTKRGHVLLKMRGRT